MSARLWTTLQRPRGSSMHRASTLGDRVASRPRPVPGRAPRPGYSMSPSKRAITDLPRTEDKPLSGSVGLLMAGVVPGNGTERPKQPNPTSFQWFMPHPVLRRIIGLGGSFFRGVKNKSTAFDMPVKVPMPRKLRIAIHGHRTAQPTKSKRGRGRAPLRSAGSR